MIIKIKCGICGRHVSCYKDGEFTCGYYEINKGHPISTGKDMLVCDECMFNTPWYRKNYPHNKRPISPGVFS